MNNYLARTIEEIKRSWQWLIFTLAMYTAATILAAYIYRIVGTAPAVLFTAHGIALAAFIMLGYVAAIPIVLGTLLGGFASGASFFILVPNALANAIAPAIALFLLRTFGFNRTLENTKDFMLLLLAAALTSSIAPTATVYTRMLFNTYTGSSVTFSWMHIWIGVLL